MRRGIRQGLREQRKKGGQGRKALEEGQLSWQERKSNTGKFMESLLLVQGEGVSGIFHHKGILKKGTFQFKNQSKPNQYGNYILATDRGICFRFCGLNFQVSFIYLVSSLIYFDLMGFFPFFFLRITRNLMI